MLKSIHLKNFFSFEDQKIGLHPKVNFLIGINGSGKSNLLKAIKILKEGIRGIGLKDLILHEWGGFDAIKFFGNEENRILLEFEFDFQVIQNFGFKFTENIFYQIEIIKSGISNYSINEKVYLPREQKNDWLYLDFENGKGVINEKADEEYRKSRVHLVRYENFDSQELVLGEINDPDRYFAVSTLKKAIQNLGFYDTFNTNVGSEIRKPIIPTSAQRLSPKGENLTQILNTLKINDKNNFKNILESLVKVNPKFIGFDFNFIGGNIELMLEEKKFNKSIPISNISDGTLKFLCLLSIFLNPNRGNIVCLDEPTLGLHPDMIFQISSLIDNSQDFGQLLISTHSEQLLNFFDFENVRVFEKNENNATFVKSFTQEDFEGWYDEFSLGQMWRKGDLGGNRW